MTNIAAYWQNYINGAWCDGGAGRVDVTDPATGEKIAECALADTADVDRAVMAARAVHLSGALSDMRPIERGRPGPGLLAHVLVSKYADHLPLYRQSQIFWHVAIVQRIPVDAFPARREHEEAVQEAIANIRTL